MSDDLDPAPAGASPGSCPGLPLPGADRDVPGSPRVDFSKPSTARMYDYYLGGKDNSEVDREAAERVLAAHPEQGTLVRTNRRFLVNAVRYVAESGVCQFLDLGTGYPTSPNVHETAREVFPQAAVCYVDHDPIVTVYNRAFREKAPGVVAVEADLREPDAVLAHPALHGVLDLDRPVALLLVAVLHFVPKQDDAAGIIARYAQALAPGSFLVLSTATSDGLDAATRQQIEAAYDGATSPAVFRTGSEILELFERPGFALVPPGLVDVARWRANWPTTTVTMLAGVGRKH